MGDISLVGDTMFVTVTVDEADDITCVITFQTDDDAVLSICKFQFQ